MKTIILYIKVKSKTILLSQEVITLRKRVKMIDLLRQKMLKEKFKFLELNDLVNDMVVLENHDSEMVQISSLGMFKCEVRMNFLLEIINELESEMN